MKRNKFNPTCAELYALGLPQLQFTKSNSNPKHHASNHAPATMIEKDIFQIMHQFDDNYTSESLQYGSMILNLPAIRARNVSLGGEAALQIPVLVENFLYDAIRLADLAEVAKVEAEWAYTTEECSKYRPDNFIVNYNGKPVVAVHLTSPAPGLLKRPLQQQPIIVDHPNVIGQLFDCVLAHQSFHAQHHVFATSQL